MNQAPGAIRAIETVYKGYRFRSRLEARWAVFFDALGVPYEYESQGFDVDGVWYLPDFWLPQQGSWVEIKPSTAWAYDHKYQALAERSGRRVLYVAGQPWPDEYGLCWYDAERCSGSDPWMFALGRRDERELWVVSKVEVAGVCLNPIADDGRVPHPMSPTIIRAYTAARQARFEHGERGAPR
jgi:hypothetical protein